jgi:hypothetical protein
VGQVKRLLLVALTTTALVAAAQPVTAAGLDPGAADEFVQWINRERAAVGAPPLTVSPDLVDGAIHQAWQIANAGTLFHNPDLGSVTTGWTAIGENVAYAGSAWRAHELLMNSPGHRTNILRPGYTHVGVGVVNSGGMYWVAQVFATLPGATFRPPFRDDDGSVHEDDIIALAAAGITTGCGVEMYCPGTLVTRGQMATFLSRAMSFPASSIDFFSDDNASVHEPDIDALAAAVEISGCGPGRYCPDDALTRGQMATLLVRVLGLPPASRDYFSDDAGSPHESDINALAAAGITNGCAPGSYCPNGAVTRAQMATFLVRSFGY